MTGPTTNAFLTGSKCRAFGSTKLAVSTSDANAAALSIDLRAGKAGGTAAQGIFVRSTGGTSGEIMHYVDARGETIFALLADGSLLLRPLPGPPAGTRAGLKLCNVGGTLGVVDSAGTFTPLT